MGGLGNQIFQIFATISYAIKSRNQFKFLNLETLGGGSTTVRYTFWNTFFSNLRPFLISELPPVHIIREKGFQYKPLNLSEMIQRDVMIFGYFQSYKYFQEQYSIICRIIGLEKMKDTLLRNLNISQDYLSNTISMHFRIGDYKKLPDYHPILKYKYYEMALSHIKNCNINQKFNVLFFCENDDIDDVSSIINTLKNKFPEFIFTRGNVSISDWEQMLLMSCCRHNIIANSSFSWWSAYFNLGNDKIVCYPSVWFGPASNNNTKDLCPPEWIRILI
jgi:hypothetical protein